MMGLHYDAGASEFISQSTDLLLEDETHSTRYHEHTAKHVFKRNNQLKQLASYIELVQRNSEVRQLLKLV